MPSTWSSRGMYGWRRRHLPRSTSWSRWAGMPSTPASVRGVPACSATRGTNPGRRRSAAATGSCGSTGSGAGRRTMRYGLREGSISSTSPSSTLAWPSRSTAGSTRTIRTSSRMTVSARTPWSGPAGGCCGSRTRCWSTTPTTSWPLSLRRWRVLPRAQRSHRPLPATAA